VLAVLILILILILILLVIQCPILICILLFRWRSARRFARETNEIEGRIESRSMRQA
jgi:Flp pilus assembly protein TadB